MSPFRTSKTTGMAPGVEPGAMPHDRQPHILLPAGLLKKRFLQNPVEEDPVENRGHKKKPHKLSRHTFSFPLRGMCPSSSRAGTIQHH